MQALSSHAEDSGADDTTTVVISNGYATHACDNVRYHRRGTYAAAVNDKLQDKYAGHKGDSAQAIILAASGSPSGERSRLAEVDEGRAA